MTTPGSAAGAFTDGAPVPRAASTVVLLRPSDRGPEVLLIERPSTMAFAPGLHAFPGGAVDPEDRDPEAAARFRISPAACEASWAGDLAAGDAAAHALAAVREVREETGIELSVEALVPLSRWTTPPMGHARRFDARFYVAELPAGVRVMPDPHEVATFEWLTPAAALEAWATRRIELWPPTSTTLEQLLRVGGIADVQSRVSPSRPAGPPEVERLGDALVRVRCHAAGGIPGQAVDAWIVGRRRLVVVDPGDPNDAAAEAILGVAAAIDARIEGVVLTSPVPDHAAGSVGVAIRAGDVPILAAGPAGRSFDVPFVALADGDPVPAGDVGLRARSTPGTDPAHLAFVAEVLGVVLVGDLEGPGPSRSILAPPDQDALAASRSRVDALGELRHLPAHDAG